MLVLEDSDEDIPVPGEGRSARVGRLGQADPGGGGTHSLGTRDFRPCCPTGRESTGECGTQGSVPSEGSAFQAPASEVQGVTVNGQPATMGGLHQDTVIVSTAGKRNFQVVGRLG
jgi:hypothetical protein